MHTGVVPIGPIPEVLGTSRTWHRSTFVALALASVAACEPEGRGAPAATAAVEVVSHGAIRSSSPNPGQLNAHPVLSIAGGRQGFVRLADVAVDDAGTIYVLDSGAQSVSIFDEAGSLVTQVGREGDGPGEFRAVRHLLLVRGAFVVPDLGRGLLIRFGRDGEFRGEVPLATDRGIPIWWADDGEGLMVQHRSTIVTMFGVGGGDAGGDVLSRVDPETGSLSAFLTLPHGGVISSVTFRLLAPEPAWDMSKDGGLVFGFNSEMNFTLMDSSGDPLRTITAYVVPEPVEESGRQIVLDLFEDYIRRAGGEPVAGLREVITVADNYPVFTRIMFGPHSTVMLERPARLSELPVDNPIAAGKVDLKGMGSGTFDVFARDGDFLGFVTLPAGFRPTDYHGSAVYGIQTDALGVQSVRAYSIDDAGR